MTKYRIANKKIISKCRQIPNSSHKRNSVLKIRLVSQTKNQSLLSTTENQSLTKTRLVEKKDPYYKLMEKSRKTILVMVLLMEGNSYHLQKKISRKRLKRKMKIASSLSKFLTKGVSNIKNRIKRIKMMKDKIKFRFRSI